MNEQRLHFRNNQLERLFQKKGFLTIPFLNSEQVALLEQVFHKNFIVEELPSVYDTLSTTPAETIKAVNAEIIKICLPALEHCLKNFHWVCSIFFVKKSAVDSYGAMHLDTSITTEEFQTIGVWIPLCDIDEKNGKICLLPGSEKFLPPYNTPSMPYSYENVEHIIESKLECICMKSGEALFFNNNILHCTQQNHCGKTRLAVIIKLIDTNAPLATVYYDSSAAKGEQVSIYQQPKDFFLTGAFRNTLPPSKSMFLKHIPELPHVFTKQEIESLLNADVLKL